MALTIPNGYASAAQQFLLAGRANPFTVVTGHFPVGPITPDEVATAVRTGWLLSAGAPGNMRTGYSLGPCKVLMRSGGGTLLFGENSNISAGTAPSTNAPPSNCSLLVQKRTAQVGRTQRGRMYVPPFMLNDADIDQAGNFSVGSLPTTFQNLLLDWADPVPLVILHTGVGTPTPVTSLRVQGRLATQRRRMR